MRSFAGGRATTSVRRNQRISDKTTRVCSSPAGQAVLHLFVSRRYLHRFGSGTSIWRQGKGCVLPQQEDARYEDQISRDREAMSLFVLHLHKAMVHPALCRDNHYLQIGCHQAYAVVSCVERPTRKVDVSTVRI
jgi:hypothetical protein